MVAGMDKQNHNRKSRFIENLRGPKPNWAVKSTLLVQASPLPLRTGRNGFICNKSCNYFTVLG